MKLHPRLVGLPLVLVIAAALCPAAARAHVSAWRPTAFHLEWREQVQDSAPRCDTVTGIWPVRSDLNLTVTAWVLRGAYVGIIYDGLPGGPAMFPGLRGGGFLRVRQRQSWVAMSCADGTQSTGSCDETYVIGEYPPVRWATSRRTHQTRFRFVFLPGLNLSRGGRRSTCGPDFSDVDGPEPSVLVPVRAFRPSPPRSPRRFVRSP